MSIEARDAAVRQLVAHTFAGDAEQALIAVARIGGFSIDYKAQPHTKAIEPEARQPGWRPEDGIVVPLRKGSW